MGILIIAGKVVFKNGRFIIEGYEKIFPHYSFYDFVLKDKGIKIIGNIHENELNADCIPLRVELKGQRYFKQLAEVIAQIAEKENLNLETFCTELKLSAREIRNKEVQQ